MNQVKNKVKLLENNNCNNEYEIATLKSSNEKLKIDNEKLKMMVDIYIGSFCNDLNKRIINQNFNKEDKANIEIQNIDKNK